VTAGQRQVIKAMAAIVRPGDQALLVSEHANPDGELFHRPLGGHVEFGEHAEDALRREFLEEIGQALADVRLLGVVENIFRWGAELAHEVVFLYAASFADPAGYEIARQPIADHLEDGPVVIWRAARAASPPLYPDGVSGLIAGGPARPR
jgi:ADP-ribose pyrophosphatase YjhB (NUDIX family)